MIALPTPDTVYIGGPDIKPAWLAGRRLLVTRIDRQVVHVRTVDSDAVLARGAPLEPVRGPVEVVHIEVAVLARGRRTWELVEPKDWHAAEATR